MTTKVVKCTCVHPYQDAKYGKGKRIGNLSRGAQQKGSIEKYRCTVCGTMRR